MAPMNDVLPAAARRVQAALEAAGIDAAVVQLADSATTAQKAADALGVVVGQIAKSLVFRAVDSGRAVLVIVAGDRRVAEGRVAAQLGEAIERADPPFVREHTGFAIGGVAPVAHARPLLAFVDPSLRRFDRVWVGGGTPHCVFGIAPDALCGLVCSQGGVELDLT